MEKKPSYTNYYDDWTVSTILLYLPARYMMLSAFLGYFTCLNTHLPRPQAVTKAKVKQDVFIQATGGLIEVVSEGG